MQEVKYVDKAGRHRNGVLYNCVECGKTYPDRKDQPSRCCSKQCRYKYHTRQNTIVVECAWCHKEIRIKKFRYKRSISGLFFCGSQCHGCASRLDGGIKEVQPKQFGTATGEYTYRDLFTDEELCCHICGYNKHIGVIQIHHIDKNRQNNKRDNLVPLCCNCHREVHLGIASFV